ncbi:hypothetical protein ACFQ3I_13895, partial [Entomomonas asaccharolytica]|uniref:hypothetical protein n=1 Tax=Entomomonas asaccharolytica TaxID=2785331 RepID=UPI00362BBE76
FSNSVVKRRIANGSVGSPHVRVGHPQAPKSKPPDLIKIGGFLYSITINLLIYYIFHQNY